MTDIFQLRKDSANGDFFLAKVGQRFEAGNSLIKIKSIFLDLNEQILTRNRVYKVVAEVIGEEDAGEFIWREFENSQDLSIIRFIPNFTPDEMLKTVLD